MDIRVLILDDKDSVLREMRNRVQGACSENPDVKLSVGTVHVKVGVDERGRPCFSDELFEELFRESTVRADIVLIDFGYTTDELATQLKELYERYHGDKEKVSPEEFRARVLTPRDLLQAVKDHDDSTVREQILANVFRSGATVVLYSYTPPHLAHAAGHFQERMHETRLAFDKRSDVIGADTLQLLYNGDLYQAHHERHFYAFQTSVLMRLYVERIVERQLLASRACELEGKVRSSRYLPFMRLGKATAAITAIGAAIGFGGEAAGGLVADRFQDGQVLNGLLMGVVVATAIFVLGFVAPIAYDRMVRGYIGRRPAGEETQPD